MYPVAYRLIHHLAPRLALGLCVMAGVCGDATPANAQSWAESWFDNVTYTSPGTLAYQMLNDLTRSIDFAIGNAERGATAAGAAEAANTNICQTRILTKGIEQLRDLREEVLRQRAQMRQSYLAALNQANLSASYAGLLRQRDRDARDAAGASATRNQ